LLAYLFTYLLTYLFTYKLEDYGILYLSSLKSGGLDNDLVLRVTAAVGNLYIRVELPKITSRFQL